MLEHCVQFLRSQEYPYVSELPVLWAGSGASLTFGKPQLALGSQSKIQLFSPKEQKRSSQQFSKMVALPTLGVYSPNPHLSVPSSSVVLKSGGIKIIWEVG